MPNLYFPKPNLGAYKDPSVAILAQVLLGFSIAFIKRNPMQIDFELPAQICSARFRAKAADINGY